VDARPVTGAAPDVDVDEFLRRPLMAHLATASPDGPRDSPLWFLWEDGAVWLVGTERDSFPHRIAADPRCAVGIVDLDVARGRLVHVGMRGKAEVVPLDAGRLHRFLARYLGEDEAGWNPWFREHVVDHLDLMVRFVPTSVVARDMSYFGTASPSASSPATS
jgi:nitroimidazol reductase NimA-like FMN-containing flavoprotein (pyridoxamine 5'-phosphate oxidase superfamily)